jgi:serine/threonine protein kinase/Flp pilus assembly protein TadD
MNAERPPQTESEALASDATQPGGPGGTVVVTVPVTERAGDRIGRYKLLQQIGEGGCGVVYMAEQEEPVRRRVALKVIKLGMDTKSVIARFEAERQALALMDHPNIARVLDAGATEAGRPFFVMELVRGVKITEYCDQNKLPTQDRLGLFAQVCQAIQHAHQKGIIHRDIKPSNILVTLHDGVPVPKVIDFGIAKATQGRLTDLTLFTAYEQFIGTPAYMSPEQAEMSGLDVDTRSDIYALGVLLYELLTGKTPFDTQGLLAGGLDNLRHAIREQEPERPSTRLRTMVSSDLTAAAQHRHTDAPKLINLIRGDLDWIVMKALEKDRTRRYATANGLAMDVERYLASEPIIARPPSSYYKFQKLVRRNRGVVAAVGAVMAALMIGLGFSCYLLVKERDERRRAVAAEREQARLRAQAEQALALKEQLLRQAEVGDKLANAGQLLNEGHVGAAEQMALEVAHPASAPLLTTLGQLRARRGEWAQAITNYSRLIELAPGEQAPYYNLAALLAYTGDRPAWQDNSRRILAQVPTNSLPSVLERMAKACLILPPAPAELAAAGKLADLAVPGNPGRKVPEPFRLAKALAEYRRDRYAVSLKWLDGAAQENEPVREVEVDAIRAMALYQRGDREAARAMLAKATTLADTTPVKNLVANAQWPERLISLTLLREAKTVVGKQ